ncbi:MAG: MBL fold metallo-hydrolase [Phycisphaerales bacterium]|nr:MBL fold metallo-hydrolase [Phycisphaerales bacterium]
MAKRTKMWPAASVRMYRQGLGDCFLISLGKADGAAHHIVIDCGVWDVSVPARERIKKCAEDIKTRTGGRIDLLVVTHEHWDHVSGFSELQARSVFASMEIKEILLAWTEDPEDELGLALKGKYAAIKHRLAAAFTDAGKAGLGVNSGVGTVLAAGGLGVGLGVGTNPSEALDWVKGLVKGSKPATVRYGMPGKIIEVPGAKIYVLGPPHSEEDLRKAQGGKKAKKEGETYLTESLFDELSDLNGMIAGGLGSGLAAAGRMAVSPGGVMPWDNGRPFGGTIGERLSGRTSNPFVREVYYGKGEGKGHAARAGSGWRGIDQEWVSAMSELALRMDKFTNNTSLALAIELTGSRRVLLFPADAQFGNWSSWDSVKFEDGVKASELLGRTVLYKVGHHGSHNATLRERGLKRMNSPDLMAMIPVDEAFAHKQPGGGWKMPYPQLLKELQEQTKGRVMRADTGLPKTTSMKPEVRSAFKKSATQSKLYVQVDL